MKKISLFLLLSCLLSINIFSQKEEYSAPVKWERYQLSKHNISLLLPKLPVFGNNRSNFCYQENMEEYAVYAEDVIYGFNVVSKLDGEIPDWCEVKRKFGKESFEKRIKEFKSEKKNAIEEKFILNGQNNSIVKVDKLIYLFSRIENSNEWIELWVVNSEISNPKVESFFKSIAFGKNIEGIEIGNGSDRTLGDTPSDSSENSNSEKENNTTTGTMLVVKPMPRYTEVARYNNYQGSVTLRVTFLANGGIGSVEPIERIPYGLTEQAISAAKRIVFIPAKRKGKNISESRRVQYSFTIY